MKKSRCYQNLGHFTHPRGFRSEVILPPGGQHFNNPFYSSWSDSCLGPGLRRVLHQLCDHKTPTDEYDCGEWNNYFRDILRTVSGLDYEFNKLYHFLSTNKRVSRTNSGRITSTTSFNDISYLDIAAKSLLELIICLKNELSYKIKVSKGVSFGSVHQTNKLVSELENKLLYLLGNLDKIKNDSDRNLCCNTCSGLRTNITQPMQNRLNCPRKSNFGNPLDQDQYGDTVSHYLGLLDNEPLVLSNKYCRERPVKLKHHHMQADNIMQRMAKNMQNYNPSGSNNNSNFPSNNRQWANSKCIKSKTRKDSHGTFMGLYELINDGMVQTRHPIHVKIEQPKSNFCGKNKSNKLNRILPSRGINRMAQASLKTAAHSQRNTLRRKRAGKDNRTHIYDPSYHTIDAFSNSSSFLRDYYTMGKTKQHNEHNKKYQKHMLPKQVNFYSTSSDQTITSDDNVSKSSAAIETDLKNNPQKYRPNRPSEKRLNKIGKVYSHINQKQINDGWYHNPKSNNLTLDISSDSSSTTKNIPVKYYITQSNGNTKSYMSNSTITRQNKIFLQINKTHASLTNTKNKSIRRRKRSNKNKIVQKQSNVVGVYPSNNYGYQKQRGRSNKSNVDNYLKRVRNNLSKIRLFSSKLPKNLSESVSSKSTRNKKRPQKDCKRIPKITNREYVCSRCPSRKRVRPHTSRHEADSTNSGSSYSSSTSQRTYLIDDTRTSLCDRTSSESYDYHNLFERIPSSCEYVSEGNVPDDVPRTLDVSNSPQQCGVCPQERGPQAINLLPHEDCDDFVDEYEVIFEKVEPKIKRHRPKKVLRKKSSSSLESVSSSLPDFQIICQPRKYVGKRNVRNKVRNLTIIKERIPPSEEVVRHSKYKRRRKYIRVGSQKFQESPEEVVDYEKYIPQPTEKNTFSRGTSTERFQPAEEKFTFHPPLKDTFSRGTSTETLQLYAKNTSTSDLIKLIRVTGTNTERVITKDTGINPIPLKQKTRPIVTELKSQFTNTDNINVRSTGTNAMPEKEKPSVVNKATDSLFYLDQKDKTTNTAPERKTPVTHVGTDPRPTEKLQQSNKATDPLYYLGQQVKYTNTNPVIKLDAQTETPKKPANVSVGITTTPVKTHDQKTSYEKVKTSSRGNNPTTVKMSDKGFQFDTVQHKPEVKTAFTETLTPHCVGKTTQTSFKEAPEVKPLVYQVQTQTEKVKKTKNPKPPPTILKQRKRSISEELAVVEAVEPSSASPSELSMHLVFEKCQEEVYKRRTNNYCMPRCSAYGNHSQKVVVCDNIRSKRMILKSSSDCIVSSITHKDKSPHSDLELKLKSTKDPLLNKFTSDYELKTFGKVQSPCRTRNLKLKEQFEIISPNNPKNQQNHSHMKNMETERKRNSVIEASGFGSSNTTFTSCDWKNIAEKVKLNN